MDSIFRVLNLASDYSLLIRMTQKKDQILQSALELFAGEGYQNTSTSKIARQADVSEGLIFKHFQSKEGLLSAIVNLANEDIKHFLDRMKAQESPKDIIKTIFEFPPLIDCNRDFWKLQFSLKYQCPHKKQFHAKHEMVETITAMLEKAFTDLGYENPRMETTLLMNIIKDMCQAKCSSENGCQKRYINFVKQKYDLQNSQE